MMESFFLRTDTTAAISHVSVLPGKRLFLNDKEDKRQAWGLLTPSRKEEKAEGNRKVGGKSR